MRPPFPIAALPVVVAVALPAVASASSETEMPPALGVDLSLGYEAEVEWAGLEEDGPDGTARVGERRDIRHDLAFRASFAPVDGVAFTFGVDGLAWRGIRYPSAREMLLDPAGNKGTSLPGEPLEAPPEPTGSGLEGLWFGVAFQPYAERYARQHEVTWRLDLAFRTAPTSSFFEVNEQGRRGAGVGGPTFLARAAFSREHQTTSPYMVARWSLQTRRQVAVPDGDGGTSEIQVDPGQRLDVRGGIEIRLSSPEASARVDLDLHAGLGYRSPAQVPSGVFLPDVLDLTAGTPVTRAERLGWHIGAGFDMDLAPAVSLNLWSRAFWALPWRIEGPYPVRTTLGTARAGFGAELVTRIR